MLGVPVLAGGSIAAAGGQLVVLGNALVGLVFISLVLLIPIGWAVAGSRSEVDAEGIRGPDNWHIERKVRWSEIRSVSRFLLPGYSLVWINTDKKRKLFWVPLFLTDMSGFRATVSAYAKRDNPLRVFLEKQ
jgi:hypothetical protein